MHRRPYLLYHRNGKEKLDTESDISGQTGLADGFFAVVLFSSGVFQGSVKDGGVRSIFQYDHFLLVTSRYFFDFRFWFVIF